MGEPPELLELPEPASPGPGELLIEVQAAGIGPWDAFVGAGGWDVGLRPPAALGVEGTGVVAAVGENVGGIATGDAVLVHEAPLPGGSGFWAEQVLVDASHCRPAMAPRAREQHRQSRCTTTFPPATTPVPSTPSPAKTDIPTATPTNIRHARLLEPRWAVRPDLIGGGFSAAARLRHPSTRIPRPHGLAQRRRAARPCVGGPDRPQL